MAARSSTGPQSPPNCQVPYASGVTSRPVAPNVTFCIFGRCASIARARASDPEASR